MNIDQNMIKEIENAPIGTFKVWEPKKTVIVLGRSSKENDDIHLNEARKNNIEILKRAGGGGTVVLSKGMLVISLAKRVSNNFDNSSYFKMINKLIINCLRSMDVKGLNEKGLSDICINDRKVLGCSLFRKLNLLFYQASLIINSELDIIDRYLKHPKREPDYRKSREHKDFLTSLKMAGYDLSVNEIKDRMERAINADLCSIN